MKIKLALVFLLCAAAAGAAPSFLDTTFNPGTGANGLIESAVVVPGGKILICGNFTTYNGSNCSYMARLNTDGSLDPTFQAFPSYWVRTMALQSDGKIVIGGFFTSVSGLSRNLVARLNSNGSLDTTFAPGTGATGVLGVAVDGDADPFVFATAIQPDGRILITGNFTNYNGTTCWGIARLNTDGSLDTTFDFGAGFNYNSWGRSLLVQSNGQIMATGWFTSYDNHSYNRMVRLNSDGSANDTFNPFFGDLTAIYGVQQLANGEYVVVGDSQNTNLFRQCMGRLHPDGSFDTNFVGASNDKTESVRIQSDGKILIAGYFSVVDGVNRSNLGRLNSDGTFDDTFTPSVDNFVWSMALQSDGRILIVGDFNTVEGESRNSIARLLPTASSIVPTTNSSSINPGTYAGLFYNADSFTNADAGYVTIAVGARSNYTARLVLGAAAYAWSGKFSNSVAQRTIARPRRDSIVVNLQLPGGNSVGGSVVIGALTSQLTAYRSPYSRANLATTYEGRYTVLLGGGSAAGAPNGDGWLVLTVGPGGGVSEAGLLADGAPIGRSAWLSDTGMAPFYVSYRGGAAVALGWLALGPNVQGDIYWSKGFSATLPVTGAPYVPPTRGAPALTLTNGVFTASSGDLTNAVSADFTYKAVARFVFPTSTNHFNALMNPANGVFSGTFLDPAIHRLEAFHGVVLQGQNTGAGYFGPHGGLITFGSQ